MDPLSKLLVALLLTPAYAAILHAILSRAVRVAGMKASNHAVAIAACALSVLPPLALAWALHEDGLFGLDAAAAFSYAIIVAMLLSYSYFHVFNMSETARRIRILREIRDSGRLRAEELSGLYGAAGMLDNRIERLVSMGQIRIEGNVYVLSSRLLYFAAVLVATWGRVLGLPSPEDVFKPKG